MKYIFSVLLTVCVISACAPEIGSKEWCDALNDKDKDSWTIGETKDFAKHCLFK